MNLKEILSEFEVVHNHIKDKNLSEAFDILKILAESSKKFDFTSQLSNYQETYKNILKYSFEYGEDPEKEMVYFRLVKSLTELADEIKEELIIQSKQLTHYNTLRKSRF